MSSRKMPWAPYRRIEAATARMKASRPRTGWSANGSGSQVNLIF